MRIWLSNEELDALISHVETPHQRIVFLVGGCVGLRRSELIRITSNGLVEEPIGKHVRICEDYAKPNRYCEPPIPDNVEAIANTLAFDQADDVPSIDVDGTTVYRWVQRAASKLEEQTDNEGWAYLAVHDLRRTGGIPPRAGGAPIGSDDLGWHDWDTF